MNLGHQPEGFDQAIQHMIGQTAGQHLAAIGFPIARFQTAVTIDTKIAFRVNHRAKRAGRQALAQFDHRRHEAAVIAEHR